MTRGLYVNVKGSVAFELICVFCMKMCRDLLIFWFSYFTLLLLVFLAESVQTPHAHRPLHLLVVLGKAVCCVPVVCTIKFEFIIISKGLAIYELVMY